MNMLSMKNYNKENMARVLATNLRISTKYSIEMSNYLRGKTITRAQYLLDKVIEKQMAMPVKRFTDGAGHKKGKIGPGKFPQKIALEFKKLLNSITKNAQTKSIDTNNLEIIHISVNKGREQYRATRHRGRTMKLTHIEIVAHPKKKEKKSEDKK
jgi:large subunit ribosomal protein L22